MGVFDWLRRGSSTKAATEAAPAESASTAPQESAKPAEPADQVGIPKQQSADKAADSETGEGARN